MIRKSIILIIALAVIVLITDGYSQYDTDTQRPLVTLRRDLPVGYLDVTPGANVKVIDMDTTDIGAGEMSYQFMIGDVSFLEIFGDYDGAGGFNITLIELAGIKNATLFISTPPDDSLYETSEAIISTHSFHRIEGKSGNVIITANPAIIAGSFDGQMLKLEGLNDSATIELKDEADDDGSTLELQGDVPFIMGIHDNIVLQWNATNSKWCEESRADLDNE